MAYASSQRAREDELGKVDAQGPSITSVTALDIMGSTLDSRCVGREICRKEMSVSQPSKYVQTKLRLSNMLREGSVTSVHVHTRFALEK